MKNHRRFLGGAAASGLLVAGVLISTTIIPSHAQQQASAARLQAYVETLPKSLVKIKMVPVPGGTVTIAGKQVTVKPFYMARTETPWEAFDVFTSSGPPFPAYDQTEFTADAIARPSKSYILPDLGWGHAGFPVINVSYLNCDMFCRWLAKETKKKYRLPTEAEWEIACRAGAVGPVKLPKPALDSTAWHTGNAEGTTHPVGKKLPNKLDICDLYGNVGEWATDPQGKPVLCGGTFLDGPAGQIPNMTRRFTPKWQETDPQFPKSRWWLADGKFCGFRLVCEP